MSIFYSSICSGVKEGGHRVLRKTPEKISASTIPIPTKKLQDTLSQVCNCQFFFNRTAFNWTGLHINGTNLFQRILSCPEKQSKKIDLQRVRCVDSDWAIGPYLKECNHIMAVGTPKPLSLNLENSSSKDTLVTSCFIRSHTW